MKTKSGGGQFCCRHRGIPGLRPGEIRTKTLGAWTQMRIWVSGLTRDGKVATL